MGKMKSWLMDQEERGVEVDKWPEMREMLEASKREAARPMDEMLDEVFSKVLGEDW